MTKQQFDESSSFDGVQIPRYDSQPDGPKIQSMTLCKCGEMWKYHRFRDGACPIRNTQENLK